MCPTGVATRLANIGSGALVVVGFGMAQILIEVGWHYNGNQI